MFARCKTVFVSLILVFSLPIISSAELKLFQETFFSETPNVPYMRDFHTVPQNYYDGPAEIGTIRMWNGHTGANQNFVQQDASGIDGRSLMLHWAPVEINPNSYIPAFYAYRTPLPTGEDDNTGVYEISWTASCTWTAPFASPDATPPDPILCDTVQIAVSGVEFPTFMLRYNGDETISYFDVGAGDYVPFATYSGNVGQRFTATVDYNDGTYSISTPVPGGIEADIVLLENEPILPGNDGLHHFVAGIVPPSTVSVFQSLAIADISITKVDFDDADGDRIKDSSDNCVNTPNPDQNNWDGDELGDVCDPCPLAATDPDTGECPTDIIEPIANVNFVNRRNGNISICVSWPDVPDNPEYAFPPNCENVHFVLEDAEGNILSPACLTSKAYDIDSAVQYIPDDPHCIELGCDLKDRFPQLPALNPLDGITIRRIVYENFVTDPGIDPITGDCVDLVTGGILTDPEACRDIWVGQIEIEPPDVFDDDPVAENDSFNTSEDTPLTDNVLDNDTDDDPLTATLVTNPTNGTLTSWSSDGNFTYEPTPDFNGSDTFTYYANDGLTDSNVATVTITIDAVADISDDSDSTIKGVPVTTDVLSNDTFEGLPTISAFTQGTNGSVKINPDSTLTYTPSVDFVGTDNYAYTVTSGGVTETAGVSIWVHYDWDGFYSPIENDSINKVKAGRAIPMKFSLGGDQGLDVFAPGYPNSTPVACDANAAWVNDIDDEIETPGNSGLTYDPTNDQYTYIWKTMKSWDGCRQLQLKLDDGSKHVVVFEFK